MFENMTFENILEQMLDDVSDDLDKREGSMIWNSLAPAASQLALHYVWLENVIELVFFDTAPDEYLERAAKPYGILRKGATTAVRSLKCLDEKQARIEVPVGSRFFVESANLYFRVTDSSNETEYQQVECESPGLAGNTDFKGEKLLALDNIYGLATAEIVDVLIPAQDEEELESFRKRFFVRLQKEAFSGNKEHYKAWAEEVKGVGKAKIYPLAYGDGTVKIVIANSNLEPATAELVAEVKKYIDPDERQGEGAAPIGSKVFVESATWIDIDITGELVLKEGKNINDVIFEITPTLQRLFKEATFADGDSSTIKLAVIANVIFSAASVLDNFNIMLNGNLGNVTPNENEIPRIGHIDFTLL
ncbi:baseplate J/gp47 family protein [Listeria booriae]|uniref:baseplate J/gp47 family protein n=1 Tax=Listeria booriae TaxID=1552123 RepID=UPI00162A3E22|nr:baseplate J/gp47 family protein [Listeria booriae]MBC1229820.1 baseplate J/gp47 family protein [Listeria booriae]